ncbi:MAG: NADH:flavin oxidoreductase [Thermoanaerobacteraceae bacterium]|nr:NADH:flavin oxidoreductase [Thermoanaerobacteraceae bacterium]
MASLLSPITINGLTLKNRIVMPPMATNSSTLEGELTEEGIKHYLDRTEGVGLVIAEHAYITLQGRFTERQLGIYDDSLLPPLTELVEKVHQKGAKIGIQITHAGSRAKSEIIGERPVAPSPVVHPMGGEPPVELSEDDLNRLQELFVRAAVRAKKAGFDMVEIHGAHGYLLGQFISPLTNKRQDRYGGDLDGRCRFPVAVVQAVRQALGEDFPLFYRLGADDRMEGGLTPAEAAEVAVRLVQAGVDCIDLSGNHCGYLVDGEQGYFVYLAEAVKPKVSVPVLVTGGIYDPYFADELVRQGKTDLVGVGRTMLREPNWAQQAVSKLAGDSDG